ncbi:MAG: hypothetical protein AABX98_02020 [Nanoarchaeota archaeon]
MAFLDKLKFWKKEEDKFAELDKQLGTVPSTQATPAQGTDDFPHHPFGGEPIGQPVEDSLMHSSETGLDFGASKQESSFQSFTAEHPGEKRSQYQPAQVYEVQPQSQQAQQAQNILPQLELVAAKLDTIRVSLESINHRLVAVERALHVQDYEETTAPRKRRGVW